MFGTFNQKKEELTNLIDLKSKVDITCVKSRQSESELKNKIDCLKSQLQVTEARRRRERRSTFSIDNLENSRCSEPEGLNIGKASDLLRLEEERAKNAMEMKKLREKQMSVQKTIVKSSSVSESLNAKIEKLESLIESELALSQEAEAAWLTVAEEKQMLCRMMEEGMVELGKVVVDYQECLFGVDRKQGELLLCGALMQEEMKGMEEMKIMQKMALEDLHSWVVDNRCSSEQVEEQLEQVLASITGIKVLLHGCT
ncbi:hypothetical protein HPP92_018835 [Vanilla planifolia]|uniref:Uncharacterized protein n=1 Tax=Vanilla planifolia TaxID=51239 RepID=A0A835Q6G3_VANPL|nr:hypothetical protein HPP92_018835 [Vanilla planifolia]